MKKWLKEVNCPGRIFLNSRDLDRINRELLNKTTETNGLISICNALLLKIRI